MPSHAETLAGSEASWLGNHDRATLLSRVACLASRTSEDHASEAWREAAAVLGRARLAAEDPSTSRSLAAVIGWNETFVRVIAGLDTPGSLPDAAAALLAALHPDHHVQRMLVLASCAELGVALAGSDIETSWDAAREALTQALTPADQSAIAADRVIALGHLIFFAVFPSTHPLRSRGTSFIGLPDPTRPKPSIDKEPAIIHGNGWLSRFVDVDFVAALESLIVPAFIDGDDIVRATRAFEAFSGGLLAQT